MDQAIYRQLMIKLDAARKDPAIRCPKPRRDAKGREAFTLLADPRARKPPRNAKQVIPYGPHGAAFLQINPATGEIFCAHKECKGAIEYVADLPPESAEAQIEAA